MTWVRLEWMRSRWRKREERELTAEKKKIREECWFFVNFAPDFLHAQAMKFTSIYRGWKRDILSLIIQNLSHWFSLDGSQLLAQSMYHELLILIVKGCLSWPLWAGATSNVVSIGQKELYKGVVRC
jgi:hypothetical protein